MAIRKAVLLYAAAMCLLFLPSTQAQQIGSSGNSNPIWVRIIPLPLRDQGWGVPTKTGQDILNMIQVTKPDVLNRFLTGVPDTSLQIPMPAGSPSMTLVPFLNLVQATEAPGFPDRQD